RRKKTNLTPNTNRIGLAAAALHSSFSLCWV
ncbi:hypothetical protein CMV_025491, partial [Castanea mollissima]